MPPVLGALPQKFTHDELVQVAKRWLTKTRGCTVALAELVAAGGDIPDAIGWKIGPGWSWLIECKVTRADFRADLKKPQRQAGGWAVGCERLYLTPAGLLKPEEIPEGWGLLEWDGAKARQTVTPAINYRSGQPPADYHEIRSRELYIALSALRRKHCVRCEAEIDQRHERRVRAADRARGSDV